MLDKNLKPVLIELNPRMSGSVHTSLVAGIPLIEDLISLAKRNFFKIKKINSKKGIKVSSIPI